MGKKSRKKGKGGGATKAARKERLQERRVQQLEEEEDVNDAPDNVAEEDPLAGRKREIMEGDRVWFLHPGVENSDIHRGRVGHIVDTDQTRHATISSLFEQLLPTVCGICRNDLAGPSVEYRATFGRRADDHKVKVATAVHCRHAFHRDCILGWLQNRDCCPLCDTTWIFAQDQTAEWWGHTTSLGQPVSLPLARVPPDDVFPDFDDLTLRFDVGDEVLCFSYAHDGWVEATVSSLWPVAGDVRSMVRYLPSNQSERVPCYGCNGDSIFLTEDVDRQIRRRPTSFRLNVGDEAVFDVALARIIVARGVTKMFDDVEKLWLKAHITSVHVLGEMHYAAYECTFFSVDGRQYSAQIMADDDEHVARVDREPRERLFDAMSQYCSRSHLAYLATKFKIDVFTFDELLVAKALECASYQALLWLQKDSNVDVLGIADEEGNNILHQIASTSNAAQFIDEAGSAGRQNQLDLFMGSRSNFLANAQNEAGETWLHILVRRGDARALDRALSPHSGLGWDLSYTFNLDEKNLQSLAAAIADKGDPTVKCIWETFARFRMLHAQCSMIRCIDGRDISEDDVFRKESMAVLRGPDAPIHAQRLVRWYHDWRGCTNRLDRFPFDPLVTGGLPRLFELIFDADADMLVQHEYMLWSRENRDEYIQPQLIEAPKGDYDNCIDGGLFVACIVGEQTYSGHEEFDIHEVQHYLRNVSQHAVSCGPSCPSWLSHMKGMEAYLDTMSRISHSSKQKEYWERKMKLLEDDSSLPGRLKILSYLLGKKPQLANAVMKCHVLDVIRERQCGVLRFMVDKGLVQLEAGAYTNQLFQSCALKLQFLENGRIPGTMSTQSFLCFSAVEFDDLQSLEYLCESGVPVKFCDGFNLLHFAAYLGRAEIVAWLHTQSSWPAFVGNLCYRSPFQDAFAVHIAARRGHIILADMLLELNVPAADIKGKLPEQYAKKSEHEFVRDWASKRERPATLEGNVKKLLTLLNASDTRPEKITTFIASTKCLDPDEWTGCGYESFDVEGPLGHSFDELVGECCTNCPEQGVAVWICARLFFWRGNWSSWRNFFRSESSGEVQLNRDALIHFAGDEGYDDLAEYLSHSRFNGVTCIDPASKIAWFGTALGEDILGVVRGEILYVSAFDQIQSESGDAIRDLFHKGGSPGEIKELLAINLAAKKTLIEKGHNKSNYGLDCHASWLGHTWDMAETHIYAVSDSYKDQHPLLKMLPFGGGIAPYERSQLHIVLATEGYTDLLAYCLESMGGWTAQMECDIARIAAFFGHLSILEMMFLPSENMTLLSDPKDLARAAMNGAGESCRWRDLLRLADEHGIPNDPARTACNGLDDINGVDGTLEERLEKRRRDRHAVLDNSLACAVLNGYIGESYNGDRDSTSELKTLQILVEQLRYTLAEVLNAIEIILNSFYKEQWVVVLRLIQGAIRVLKIQPELHHDQMQSICEKLVENYSYSNIQDDANRADFEERLFLWLESMSAIGIDLQQMKTDILTTTNEQFLARCKEIQKQQLHNWSRFDAIKKDGSLGSVQAALNRGTLSLHSRDRGGLLLTHLSAAYDLIDSLEWLVAVKGMDLDALDGKGRTSLDVAMAAKATSAMQWITEWKAKQTIVTFLHQNYRRAMAARRQKRLAGASTLIQKCFRGRFVRKLYSGALLHRLEEAQRFAAVWGDVVQLLPDDSDCSAPVLAGWSDIREAISDIKHADFGQDDVAFDDTDEQLSKALDGALQIEDIKDEMPGSDIDTEEVGAAPEASSLNNVEATEIAEAAWLSFQVTSHVVKFLKRVDATYRGFFVRRMEQLARGERSRILQKRLKGSQSTIFETYLEQKSGFRILWTEEGDNIVVWVVSKHKEVSRFMKLIDDSKSRSARQQLPEELAAELRNDYALPAAAERKEVLLGVYGNVPLKVYDIPCHSINEIAGEDWTPALHLTDEERDVVESEDRTVLVLGRSGTGKTVCICNRMEHDRQMCGRLDPSFSQLFVARSKRLCRYVSLIVGPSDASSFCTFEEVLRELEMSLPVAEGSGRTFLPSQKIDFNRFRREFYRTDSPQERKVGALIAWTVIRTFLKGSIEAFQCPDGILPKENFVAVETLGKNRCRVPAELRDALYDDFLRYEQCKNTGGLWDDCDRIRHLVLRLNESKHSDPAAFDLVRKSRIYVDEIQDYTQLECLLFFLLGGAGGLFLAGDPAQSVVEGTEFRFDEIRGVAHYVAGSERRGFVPQKPKTVNVNFRSHSGILKTAGAFLDLLFRYFPSSAKQLKKDFGLFRGSRPSVMHKIKPNQLAMLLSDKLKGTVVLCHDDSARHWQRVLGDYKLVYGIRESKGLEFKSVIILDFFRELPPSVQKPWRNLILGREGSGFETEHPLVGTHLKLLYTGITRSIERLFFVETTSSVAGDAIVRWLTTSSIKNERNGGPQRSGALATKSNVTDIEAMAMTLDEFLAEGFNNAELAESAELDLEQAQNSLDRAIWCFEQAGSSELAGKARLHRTSVQFRRDLLAGGDDGDDPGMVETQCAQIMASLTKEGLLSEALNACYSISGLVSPYTKNELERHFVSTLRETVDE